MKITITYKTLANTPLPVSLITKITLEIERNVQIPPTRESDRGKFCNITICQTCGRTAALLDQQSLYPCPSCGGDVRSHKTGGVFHEGAWYVVDEPAV